MSENQQELPGMPKLPKVDKAAKSYLDAGQEVKNALKAREAEADKVVAAMKVENVSRYVVADIDGDKVFSIEDKKTLKVRRAKAGSRPRMRKAA